MAIERICSVEGCDKPCRARNLCSTHYGHWREATGPKCAVDNCSKPVNSNGLCKLHASRLRKYGDPLYIWTPKPKPSCSVSGCTRPHEAHSLCRFHYERQRTGRPLDAPPLTKAGEPARYFCEVVSSYDGYDCLFWPYSRTDAGYGKFYHEGRLQQVHRVICTVHNGPAPSPVHEAAHTCGNGHQGCCAKRHLVWKTPKENTGDQVVHGTRRYGERHQNSKLTENDVRQMRALKGVKTQREIAALFNTTESNVWCILKRKNWKWLE